MPTRRVLSLGACALALLAADPDPEPPASLEPFAERPGLALRAGLDAARAGSVEQGTRLLALVAERHPEIADHAASLEAEVWLEAGRPDEALRVAGAAIALHPSSPIVDRLHRVVGDARSAKGDQPEARAAWDAALAADPPVEQEAPLRLAVAESLEREGRLDAAGAAYASLWVERPTTPEAAAAAARLGALETRLGRPLRGARDLRRRADRLFQAQRTAEALADYEAALAVGLPGAERRRVEQQRAHCLFRLRRYPEAVEAFSRLGADAESRLWRARSLARGGDVPRATRELEALGGRSTGRLAVWARLLAALLLDDEGEAERARALYASVASASGERDFASVAAWQLAWTAYREGRDDEARERLLSLAEWEIDPIDRLRPRYWAARALGRARPEPARAEFEAIARDYPFSYYGWRAGLRVGDDGVRVAAEPPVVPRGQAALAPHDLERPRILLEAGLEDRALRELQRLAGRASGVEDRLEVARLFADAGDFAAAQGTLVTRYAEPLARGPVRGLEELWWLAWPDAYADLVRGSLDGDAGVEAELVYAVMREESGYRPDAVSSAGAIGLLQIMPSTGERLAHEIGLPSFTAEDLRSPAVNVRLGGFYLDRLARRFDGRLSATAASYNAGPDAVDRWLASTAGEDDEWVESIPYSQTRAYVKRVLRSLHAYRVLY